MLNYIDWIIIGVIILSVLLSFWRGFMSEVISTIAWLAGIIVSLKYYTNLIDHIDFVENPYLKIGISIAVIFLSILFIGGLINLIIGKFIKKTGLSVVDRILGSCFGFIRGVLIVGAVLFVAGYFAPIVQLPAWQQSVLIPEFKFITDWLNNLTQVLNIR